MKDSVGAPVGNGVNGNLMSGGAAQANSIDHDHDDHSTHEDRKTSTSSDA